MAECHDSNHFTHSNGTISNYGIGMNYVENNGCGYRPIGLINGYIWQSDGNGNAITIRPDMRISNDANALKGAYVADWPTTVYSDSNPRKLSFWGLGAIYYKSSAIYRVGNINASSTSGTIPGIQSPLEIGQELAKAFLAAGTYGFANHYSNACCRDWNTGTEWIWRPNGKHNRWVNDYTRRSIVYGNWYKDKMPECIKYADHVMSLHDPGIGHLAYPATQYSYFRSPSILISNTLEPHHVTEEDALDDEGNLVFDFNTNWTKGVWHKLVEVETWDATNVFMVSRRSFLKTTVTNDGRWYGGSISTLYCRITDEGLEFGASGEMGGRYDDNAMSSSSYLGSCIANDITFEMTSSWRYSTNRIANNSRTDSATFHGHGIKIKARIKNNI